MINLAKRRELFWEVSENRINQVLIENDEWVIVRVFEYGTLEDIYDVIEFYGEEKTIQALKTNPLRPMASGMAFLFFRIDPHGKYSI